MTTKVNNRMIDGSVANVTDFSTVQQALDTGLNVDLNGAAHLVNDLAYTANSQIIFNGTLASALTERILNCDAFTDCGLENVTFNANTDVAASPSNTNPSLLISNAAHRFSMRNCSVTNGSTTVTYGRFARVAASEDCIFTNNVFEGWGSGVILFKDGSHRGIVSDSVFNDKALISDAGGHAVDAEGVLGAFNAITGIMVTGNTFECKSQAGQFTGGVYNSKFSNNVCRIFSSNVGNAFKFDRCGARNECSNNQFYGDFRYGVNHQDDGTGEGVYISGNTFQSNSTVATDSMIRTANDTNSPTYIEHNIFFGLDDNGILMAGCNDLRIKRNDFYGTNVCIRWTDNTVTQSGHQIIDNYYEGDNSFLNGSIDKCIIRGNTIDTTHPRFLEIHGQISDTVIDSNFLTSVLDLSVFDGSGGTGGNTVTNNVNIDPTSYFFTPVLEGNNL